MTELFCLKEGCPGPDDLGCGSGAGSCPYMAEISRPSLHEFDEQGNLVRTSTRVPIEDLIPILSFACADSEHEKCQHNVWRIMGQRGKVDFICQCECHERLND